MSGNTRDSLLGRIAIAVSIGCALVLAATIGVASIPNLGERLGWQSAVRYRAGQQIDLDAALYAGSPRTVFFFARSSCSACQVSKPVMAAIVREVSREAGVRVVLVAGQTLADAESERTFAREIGLEQSQLLRTDLGALRLRSVPAVVLTDAAGSILLAREGLLTEGDRSEIVRIATEPFAH
jgi:hypothetical protein